MASACSLTSSRVRALRMRAQGLAESRAQSVPDAVRTVCALQAQDTRAARLAVRCRSLGLSASAVDHACGEERSVVRTWLMRGTLHMVAAEDVGWMVALLGAKFAAADRGRRLELGLDEATCERALSAIRDVLSSRGPLTRPELVAEVRVRGIAVDSGGQAGAHLVAYAAMRGLTCRGPERGHDEPTYVLLADWVGAQTEREPEAALAELARRYLSGHSPATPADFAAWAGIGAMQARAGFRLIGSQLVEVDAAGEPAWMLAPATIADDLAAPSVRLLPAFDAYLLGYASRELAVPAQFARRIQAGGGWIHPVVVADGLAVSTWRLRRHGQRLIVQVESFEGLPDGVSSALDAEVADVGRFLTADAVLVTRSLGQ